MFIYKFKGTCGRYWPKNSEKKNVSGAIFSLTPLASSNDANYKKIVFYKRYPLMSL